MSFCTCLKIVVDSTWKRNPPALTRPNTADTTSSSRDTSVNNLRFAKATEVSHCSSIPDLELPFELRGDRSDVTLKNRFILECSPTGVGRSSTIARKIIHRLSLARSPVSPYRPISTPRVLSTYVNLGRSEILPAKESVCVCV